MTRPNWPAIMHALVLVRLGQELGTDGELARGVHAVIEILLAVLR
jgi:hypothetical protein